MKERAIVAFPAWSEPSASWVESLRSEHDPRASMIKAHFTLVFPTGAPEETVRHQLAAVAASHPPLPFSITRAVAVAERGTPGGHVFLVPELGADDVVRLHDRLYTGDLASELRSDLPYQPHITIAAHARIADSEALSNRINRDGIRMHGVVEALTLVELDAEVIRVLDRFALGPPGGPSAPRSTGRG